MRAAKGPLVYLAEWGRYDMGDAERWHVLEARRLGLSWEEIAQALGRSKQAVWERWQAFDAACDPASGDLSENYGFAYIGVPLSYGIAYGGKEIDAGQCRRYVLKRLRRLRREALRRDEEVPRLVDQARGEGATWSDIALALGISRQAAWRRYSSA